jgi:hypothetical protein
MDFTAQAQAVTALRSMYAQIERDPSQTINLLPIVVFMAFSVEAYLNSLGSRKLAIWDELERLPWEKKMQILHKVAGKELDKGRAPLQFAYEVFKLRDRLAHGRPERVLGPVFTDPEEAETFNFSQRVRGLEPDWYKKITKEWIMDANERFRLLMTYLGALFSLHESDHLMHASGGFLVDDGKSGPS